MSTLTSICNPFIVASSVFKLSIRCYPSWRGKVCRSIRGAPRRVPPGELTPLPARYKFKVDFPKEYTIEPLKLTKLAGRDPETGHVNVKTLGGGEKYDYLWVDHFRKAPPGEVLVELVEQVQRDPVRSGLIALVGSGKKRRWIVATANMKAGDRIETSSTLTNVPIYGVEGNAHPVGSLAVGSKVCCIEPVPGVGAKFCNAAASSATIVRSLSESGVVVKLPSNKEVVLDPRCMAVVGAVSGCKTPLGSPQMMRWTGHRPRSGLKKKKDGYCGRKIKSPAAAAPPKSREKKAEILTLTLFPYDHKYKKRY